MQTNIFLFLLYSIISVIIYYIIPLHRRNLFLLVANALFYLLCDMRFFLLIILSIIWSYIIGLNIDKSFSLRNHILFLGIFPIVFLLCFFKYYHFFLSQNKDALVLLMPLGISYYTFKIISYLLDVYFQKRCAEKSFINYAIYVSFFPQIICGPISRSLEITSQLQSPLLPSLKFFKHGGFLILSGLYKKIVIADRLNIYVSTIFSSPSSYPSLALWMAAFFYTIQIYCDFAGYSEIAIGVCNLFGIKCTPNFDNPYFSYNIKDFWRKWHISLSSWLRDYIYIPLGGNQKGKKSLNILITFIVSGIWHGTGMNFICWGIWHGLLNLLPSKKFSSKFAIVCQTLFTFILVIFGWILFKSSSLLEALKYIILMFQNPTLDINIIIQAIMPFTGDYSCLSHLITILMFILILFIFEFRKITNVIKDESSENCLKCIIYILSIIFFGMIGHNSFLYANF